MRFIAVLVVSQSNFYYNDDDYKNCHYRCHILEGMFITSHKGLKGKIGSFPICVIDKTPEWGL